jgi:hypothetical protein
MSSVSELHTRIEELSSAIVRQKEVLRDLEKLKSDAQSDLNAILDPMARLPLEISSSIFGICLPNNTIPKPNPHEVPMLFMNVCRLWNKIAISTPSLWAAIRIEEPSSSRIGELLDVWLRRARNNPLSISLYGDPDADVREFVLQNAHRVETLHLHFSSGDELEEVTTPLPSLKRLIIGKRPVDDYSEYSRTAKECIQILGAAPALLECTFQGIYYDSDVDDHVDLEVKFELTHSTLKHLRLGKDIDYFSTGSTSILKCLTLPALESLCISHLDISYDNLLQFFTRSSPPLKVLEMQVPRNVAQWSGEEIFHLLPNLTDLHLSFSEASSQSSRFLELLATESPSQVLPNLRNINLDRFCPNCSPYEKLAKILTARRSHMHTFRLTSPSLQPPGADILVCLRELVAGGMKIHIGRSEENYV